MLKTRFADEVGFRKTHIHRDPAMKKVQVNPITIVTPVATPAIKLGGASNRVTFVLGLS